MMEWVKYTDVKDQLNPGEVLVATFKHPESINRVICTCTVGNNGELINVRSGQAIENIEPDYVFYLEKPDQFLMVYYL